MKFKRSRKLPPGTKIGTIDGIDRTAFVTWADSAMKAAAERMTEKFTGIAADDYVYLANETVFTFPEYDRDRLVNGDWSTPEAPPMTTRPIDDPESEEYRAAAFKSEWAEMIGLFNIAGSGSPLATEAIRVLRARLNSHGMKSYNAIVALPPDMALQALAPRHILKPAALPTGPFGPSVTAESPEALAEQMAAMRADPVLSAKMRGAGYLTNAGTR